MNVMHPPCCENCPKLNSAPHNCENCENYDDYSRFLYRSMNQPQTIFNINCSGQSDYQVFSNSWIQSRNQNNIYGSNTGSNMNQDFVPNPYLEYLEKQAKTQGNQNNYGQESQIAVKAPIPLSNTNNSQPVNAAINNQGTTQEEQLIVIPPQTPPLS